MRTLLLSGKHKELRANQTTWKTLITLFGDDTQEWIGKKIQLVLAQKEVKGELLDTIFVRGVQAPKVKPPAPKAPPAGVHPDDGDLVPDTGSDDSVPF
jgi:hypothetical protein